MKSKKLGSSEKSVRIAVPYKSQLDNGREPFSTCNVTSLAMCFDYYDVGYWYDFDGKRHRSKKDIQLEDELYDYMKVNGLNKHSPQDLAKTAIAHGVTDNFDAHATFGRCKKHLDTRNPCIIHGYFTQPGHIIVLVGYDDKGFLVHDPYGEWFETGYRTDLSGEYLHYSYDLIQNTCAYDDQFWVHFMSKP
jgi:hypothetical protein